MLKDKSSKKISYKGYTREKDVKWDVKNIKMWWEK